jgi:hypothetical protein
MSTFDEAEWLAHEELLAAVAPTYVIGFSGPPRSGKDSVGYALGRMLKERHVVDVVIRALSMPMRRTIYALLGMEYTLEHYEKNKDVPRPELAGKSIRQAMIALSEDHVKPTYGQGFWGSSMLNTLPMERTARVVIVTDMGFDAEVAVLEEAFNPWCCVWPQIVRPDCTFEGDSRSYVGNLEYRTTIINDTDVETAAGRIYGRLVNQFRWDLPTRS